MTSMMEIVPTQAPNEVMRVIVSRDVLGRGA